MQASQGGNTSGPGQNIPGAGGCSNEAVLDLNRNQDKPVLSNNGGMRELTVSRQPEPGSVQAPEARLSEREPVTVIPSTSSLLLPQPDDYERHCMEHMIRDKDFKLLEKTLSGWQNFSAELGLTREETSELEGISDLQEQRLEVLRKWKEKSGKKTDTYTYLALYDYVKNFDSPRANQVKEIAERHFSSRY